MLNDVAYTSLFNTLGYCYVNRRFVVLLFGSSIVCLLFECFFFNFALTADLWVVDEDYKIVFLLVLPSRYKA